ncbi:MULTISPECIES: DNA methyltransferase [unclassified Flavobacterium]|uniref:Eco57I restriction-modification methylase domain-containing protein n=1 Tax=unclassified Flavobacterium TaxID=196869 RepID=UPI001290DDE0|nr:MULTISPECIES: DNA methyltransferase [unclassified Flavobacterium]MQP52695.1 N-6 DNA methylase [Flavobacterium sp. LMO9]MQP62125.1 N-6 DNA methylase [Flavobacterium sp. LMO6]
MALFQTAVIKKYLQAQNKEQLKEKWLQFQHHFHNPTIQENIRNSKEEQYQGEFLIDLFVNVLGYTKNPQPNFNLTTEYKNVKDSKKADGAILIDEKVRAVIELKGTNTTDLSKIETQAFGYKNNQPDCIYIITSNFEKIRFYIDNAIEYLEFNLFQLQPNEFELLYLCLAHENLSKGIAKSIKEESVSQEDVITKKLYKDYSLFKRELYHNLVALNPEFEPLELFQKSQKLLDRFLFIFFAEDRNLLPTNLIFRINKEWQNLRLMRIEVSLYERYKVYFNDLNSGAKVVLPAFSETASKQIEEHQIFAYNGGLFKADEILDTIKIDDSVLFKHTVNLSNYDFASEVDVNILGHIFENSLNELDEIKAKLEGEVIDKTKTKRKKDGVFYTPKYITKYIVENTIGKLCNEKKIELQLNEEDYTTDKKRQKKTLQGLIDKLQLYRNWLLQLTICDPACGSGAFLNQALDFLIEEHKYIDELQAKLFGDTFILSDVENSILENNLFGVDLNEESVEIAKLSLWLRTAQPNRKLNDLNGNIKCGNSLIDNPEIAGKKAFNWQQAFPKVFAKGGFDLIIGNPPYVRVQNLNYAEIDFYKNNFTSAHKRVDISLLFFEKGFDILKDKGLLAFITTIQFLNADYGRKIRGLLLNKQILEFIDYNGLPVFEGATTYPGILILKNSEPDIFKYKKMTEIGPAMLFQNSENFLQINPKVLSEEVWVLNESDEKDLLKKIESNSFKLKTIANPCTGLTTGADSVFVIKCEDVSKLDLETELLLPVVRGRNISRGRINDKLDFVIYPYELINGKTEIISLETLKTSFPKAYSYLVEHKNVLANRMDSRKEMGSENEDWYKLVRKGKLDLFKSVKILTPGLSKGNRFAIDRKGMTYLCGGAGVFGLVQNKIDNDVLLSILNSKVIEFYLHSISTKKQGGYYSYLNRFLEEIPISKKSNSKLKELSVKLQLLHEDFNKIEVSLLSFIEKRMEGINLSEKILGWVDLSYVDFISELNKCLKASKLEMFTAKQEFEWMDLFEDNKKNALILKNEIAKIDKTIDQIVYELYGLSDEEISIVENS